MTPSSQNCPEEKKEVMQFQHLVWVPNMKLVLSKCPRFLCIPVIRGWGG